VNRVFSTVTGIIVGLLLVVAVGFGLWMMKSNRETEKLNAALTNEISSLKTLVNQKDKEIGNLRTEMQDLGRLKDSEKTALTEEISSLKTQVNLKDKEIGNLRTEMQDLGRLKDTEKTALTEEISSLKTQVNLKDKEIGNLRTEMQDLGRLKDTEKTALTEEISSLKTQVNLKDKEIGNLRTEMQDLGRLKEQYTAKNEEAGRYKRQKNELSQANRELEQQIKTLSAEINREKARAQQLATERTELTGQLTLIKAGVDELASARKKAERTVQIQQQLIKSLKEEIAAGQVKITELSGRTAIRLEDKILFDSGYASIKDSGLSVLNKIGKTLKEIRDRHIQVEGHTDSRPLKWQFKARYPTNWELSTARATTIVRYLIDEVEIKPSRLSAAGFAFYRPVASNDSPTGRQENRRVEFVLLPIS